MQVGACGISCDVCGLKAKNICQGCMAGNDPNAAKKVDFLKSIKALCPVLDCAVKKKIPFCSKDCKDFPCQIFEKEYPFSKGYLGMYKSRIPQK
ncbi:MAG: hypothetical protein ACTSR8_13415 [Promethearchaeota archaeon]